MAGKGASVRSTQSRGHLFRPDVTHTHTHTHTHGQGSALISASSIYLSSVPLPIDLSIVPPHIYLSSLYSPFLLPPTHLLIHRSTFPSSVDFDFRSEKLNGSCALTHLLEFSNTLRLSRQTVSWIWLKGLKSGRVLLIRLPGRSFP